MFASILLTGRRNWFLALAGVLKLR
jgi:hypothetical protein